MLSLVWPPSESLRLGGLGAPGPQASGDSADPILYGQFTLVSHNSQNQDVNPGLTPKAPVFHRVS